MEKLPTDYFAIVKWWTGLKITDKLLAYLLAGIIAISTTCFRIYSAKEEEQQKNLNARVECEQRVAAAEKFERRRNDSVNNVREIKDELKRQNLFLQRTPEIKSKITKIDRALK